MEYTQHTQTYTHTNIHIPTLLHMQTHTNTHILTLIPLTQDTHTNTYTHTPYRYRRFRLSQRELQHHNVKIKEEILKAIQKKITKGTLHYKQKIRCTLYQASQYEPWKSKHDWFSSLMFSPLSQWCTVSTLCPYLTGSCGFLGFCHFYFCVAHIVYLVYSHHVYLIFTPLAFLPNDIYVYLSFPILECLVFTCSVSHLRFFHWIHCDIRFLYFIWNKYDTH